MLIKLMWNRTYDNPFKIVSGLWAHEYVNEWHTWLVQNTEKFSKLNVNFTPHFYHPNDHPRLFRYPLQASSTPRVRCPIFAITAQYGALCLYCWQCCPLLTAHHRHHTDTRASQYRLVAWQVGLGPPSPSCPPHPHPATGPGSPGWRPMCPLM